MAKVTLIMEEHGSIATVSMETNKDCMTRDEVMEWIEDIALAGLGYAAGKDDDPTPAR